MEPLAYDVGGVGTVVLDQQVVLPRFPGVDTKTEVLHHRLQVGGPVPTALTLLSRFGRRCMFVGRWAADWPGGFIAEDLLRERLDVDGCVRDDSGSTGLAHVWIDHATATRTIAYWRGGIAELDAVDIDEDRFALCRVLHLDGWSSRAAIRAAEIVRGHGGHVFLDAGSPKPGTERLIPLVHCMICPQRFMEEFFGHDNPDKGAAQLRRLGVDRVALTRGAAGCLLYAEDGRRQQPAYDVDAVDTTGAGDVFCGAMIHAYLQRMDIDQTLRFAAAASALKCKKLGNRDALPSLDQAMHLAEL